MKKINWKKSVLYLDSKLENAIKLLDKNDLKIVLVLNKSGYLVGTITDGDIRRGLIKGFTTKSHLSEIMNKKPLTAKENSDKKKIKSLIKKNKINYLPVVNKSNKIVDLIIANQLNEEVRRNELVIIMAGGKGTRLLPLTKNCPKPLLQVAGKPILQHIIENAKKEGFCNFIITLNYLGGMIREYFQDGTELGVKIRYIQEKKILGTAGSLSLLNLPQKETLIVINGDVLTNTNLVELINFHQSHNATATIAVREVEYKNPYGVIKTNGIKVLDFIEKPVTKNYVSAGLYVLNYNSLNLLKKNLYCDMPTFISKLQSKSKKIIAFPIHESWIDVGFGQQLKNAELQIDNFLI